VVSVGAPKVIEHPLTDPGVDTGRAEVDVVELRGTIVALAQQKHVAVGHDDLLGHAFLGRRQPLLELLLLLGVEASHTVPIGLQVPQGGEGPGRCPDFHDRWRVGGHQHPGVLVGSPGRPTVIEDLPGCGERL
jgi:hypothetical protein